MDKIQGFLYDIARGLRGDPAYIEMLIKRLAGYGYNMLILHLEYRFQFKKHPSIGMHDSLSAEDIKYLDKVAIKHGMELVPCVNCAGHFEGIGVLEKYKDYSVDKTGMGPAVEQIIVGEAKSLSLITDLYKELMECFSSKFFHIGGDEIRRIKEQMPDSTQEERMAKAFGHFIDVIELVKSQSKTPMMWGDMLVKHREYISQIPDDVILCDWMYYDNPARYGPGRIETQQFFKDSGKRVLACPAVNGFYGNPIVSENSTKNIIAFSSDNVAVNGDGTLLCSWETNFGSCFSTHWPWIYLQNKVLIANRCDGVDLVSVSIKNESDCLTDNKNNESDCLIDNTMNELELNFLRNYTRDEWGMDSDYLKEWYETIDVKVQDILLTHSDRPFILIKNLRHKIFRTSNILPAFYDSLTWFNSENRCEIRNLLIKGQKLADTMHKEAKFKKEEPFRLLQWTRTFIAITDLAESLDSLEKSYHKAAMVQGIDNNSFDTDILHCIDTLIKMVDLCEILKQWSKVLVVYEDQVVDEEWWILQAQKNLLVRVEDLKRIADTNASLINFNRFIRLDAGIPNRVLNR